MSSTAVPTPPLDRSTAAGAPRSAVDWRDLVPMPGPGIVRF